MKGPNALRCALAGLALAGLLAGCGDDDDDNAAGSTTSADTGQEASGDLAAFCDGYFELNASEPTAEAIRDVEADAPEAAKEPLDAIATGFEEEAGDFTDSEEFGQQYEALTKVVADECADESMAVTASEYKFEGIPSTVAAGVVAVEFENGGGEMHEIIVLRKKDGVTESFEDILAKPEDDAEELVDVSFGAFGPPGSTSTAVFDMSEAGDFAAVCFIPVGSTPDKAEDEVEGPPHFTQGMITEFTVE